MRSSKGKRHKIKLSAKETIQTAKQMKRSNIRTYWRKSTIFCQDLRESMISTVAATQEENNEKVDEEVQDLP
jgi:hypothetical protein